MGRYSYPAGVRNSLPVDKTRSGVVLIARKRLALMAIL